MKLSYLIILSIIITFSIGADYAFATNDVPDWIKNNAMWWAEGKITEQEYIAALQYLADEGILQISSTENPKPESKLPTQDENRAKSYIVRFSGGELEHIREITTFSNFIPSDKPSYLQNPKDLGISTFFTLESNPSRDKLEFYDLIASYYNPGKKPELFDAEVDVLGGDNVPIITVKYSKCEVINYIPSLQEFNLFYQYSNLEEEEIRDKTIFKCNGIKILVDESSDKHESEITIPSSKDRVASYVVHFFGADFDGVYSLGTFFNFSPSQILFESNFDIITEGSNPVDGKPRFYLESFPSRDKKQLYEFYAKYVNPGQPPELFKVSIDSILGDGTILQRWNYVDCDVVDYGTTYEENLLIYSIAKTHQPEIRDRSDFSCNGFNLDVGVDLPKSPIKDAKTIQGNFTSPHAINSADKAESFVISVFGGELSEIFVVDDWQKFEPIRKDSRPLTPNAYSKQYDFGFVLESLPTHDRKQLYEFFSRYTNPGLAPQPFDVTADTLLGDGSNLHRLHYTNCDAIDFTWYLQGAKWINQYSNLQQEEIRERYTMYCEGYKIEFP